MPNWRSPHHSRIPPSRQVRGTIRFVQAETLDMSCICRILIYRVPASTIFRVQPAKSRCGRASIALVVPVHPVGSLSHSCRIPGCSRIWQSFLIDARAPVYFRFSHPLLSTDPYGWSCLRNQRGVSAAPSICHQGESVGCSSWLRNPIPPFLCSRNQMQVFT